MQQNYVIGIELGSTRIKSVLIDAAGGVVAQGAHEWENRLEGGYWTYSLDAVTAGLQASYTALNAAYRAKSGQDLTRVGAIGISAMMHGYLAFDAAGDLLVPFRTWRNTTTAEAAAALSEAFAFNIPQRWSVAHYYQSVLDGEPHVGAVDHINTLAGYVHELLTGQRVLGIGDASGMFPIEDGTYSPRMLARMNDLLRERGIDRDFATLLPAIGRAGELAGRLTEAGARLLDPTGKLEPGCILCPPEGDAGTGMIATNSIAPRTANVSAGTSAFLMVVIEQEPANWYPEIDMVTTPTGRPVAMIHANNFTSEINAWASLFDEVITLGGGAIDRGALFDALFRCTQGADSDCGGLVGYNFLAGEPIAGVKRGIPLTARLPEGRLTLANFMKMQVYSALGALAMGMDILRREQVSIDSVCGHGGFFKTPQVGQRAMSAAIGAPVTVMETAGEGGAWGMAVLAMMAAAQAEPEACLATLFADAKKVTVEADDAEKVSFAAFMQRYRAGLAAERQLGEAL